MRRTSILLPPDLRNRADALAKRMGVSFGEVVRRALQALLETSEDAASPDAFLTDGARYEGSVPPGASVHHDRHLYGEEP